MSFTDMHPDLRFTAEAKVSDAPKHGYAKAAPKASTLQYCDRHTHEPVTLFDLSSHPRWVLPPESRRV
jgi:hypothetical protein